MDFNKIIKVYKEFKIKLNSIFKVTQLRLMGATVGRGVHFYGKLHCKFNGDPKRIIIGNYVTFLGDADLRNRENGRIIIGDYCAFEEGLRLVAARESTIRFGEHISAGFYFVINAGGNITIGKKSIFSSFVHINGSAHPTFRDDYLSEQGYIQGSVEIGEDVWMANCTNVLMNSVIERGCIVSANTVVSGKIPEYSIVVGNPGKIVGKRLYRDDKMNLYEDSLETQEVVYNGKVNIENDNIEGELLGLFQKNFSYLSQPDASINLRKSGILDSINWLNWVDVVESHFNIKLSETYLQNSKLDSIELMAKYFQSMVSDKEPLKAINIPNLEYHLFQEFERRVAADPKRIILNLQAEGEEFCEYSYQNLYDMIIQRGIILYERGVKTGDRIVIIATTSIELVISFFASLRIGAIPSIHSFPSSKVSPDIYVKNHKEIFFTMKPEFILCQLNLKNRLENILPDTTKVFDINVSGEAPDCILPEINLNLDEIAFIQHSSGSTGVQKGVALSHSSVSKQLIHYSNRLKLNTCDKVISWLPLYHDMGLVSSFLLPLLSGTPLVLMSPFDWINKPLIFLDLIEKERATMCWFPNFAFNLLAKRFNSNQNKNVDLSSMRKWISCSEPVIYDSMKNFYQAFKNCGVQKKSLNTCYAMAENTFAVTQCEGLNILEIDPLVFSNEQRVVIKSGGKHIVSQGTVVEGSSIKILSKDENKFLGEGFVGEVFIMSDSMLKEYYKNPTASKDAFYDGYFKTGDLGFIWENELYITGRCKDLIIVAGRNFYPHDIEEVAGKLEEVKDGRCCAFGIFHEKNGTEEIVLLVEESHNAIDKEKVISEIKKCIFEELDCVISEIVFLEQNVLRKTSSGKISRAACREWYLEHKVCVE